MIRSAMLIASLVLVLLPATSVFARGGGGHGGGVGHGGGGGRGGRSGGSVSVRGYTRSNGTHVAPYTRRAPGTAGTSSAGGYSIEGGTAGNLKTALTAIENHDDKPQFTRRYPIVGGTISDLKNSLDSIEKLDAMENDAMRRYGAWNSTSVASSSHHRSRHAPGVERDNRDRIERSTSAKDDFKEFHPCPCTGMTSGPCPGYVIDHIIPLKRGGPDAPINMQWQTIEDAKAKDKWE